MNSKNLDRLIKEALNEKLSDARSEIGYSKDRKSRKPQKKAYNKASRRHSQRDIADQEAELSLTDLDTATIADLVPIGRDAFLALDGENSFEDPSTGRVRRFSMKTQYIDNLAWDIMFGDIKMDPDRIDRLAELSPEFESSLKSSGYEHRDFEDRGYNDMNESDNKFGRDAIRDFFRDTLYGDISSTPRLRKKSISANRVLTESYEDHSLPQLDAHDANRLAQAIVTGINLEFDVNASGPALVDIEEQVQYHMAKHPELPAILFDIAMDALGDAMEGDDVGPGSNYDSESSADGPLRAELIDIVASEMYSAMDSSSFSSDALRDLVFDMIDANRIDSEDWNMANIDDDEIRDRIIEFEEANADFTGL